MISLKTTKKGCKDPVCSHHGHTKKQLEFVKLQNFYYGWAKLDDNEDKYKDLLIKLSNSQESVKKLGGFLEMFMIRFKDYLQAESNELAKVPTSSIEPPSKISVRNPKADRTSTVFAQPISLEKPQYEQGGVKLLKDENQFLQEKVHEILLQKRDYSIYNYIPFLGEKIEETETKFMNLGNKLKEIEEVRRHFIDMPDGNTALKNAMRRILDLQTKMEGVQMNKDDVKKLERTNDNIKKFLDVKPIYFPIRIYY